MNVAKGSIYTFAAHVLIFMQSLIMIPVIVKESGVEMYGYYTILISLFSVVYGVSSFGFGYKAMRYLPSANTKEQKSKLFIPQFYFQLGSIIVLSVFLTIIIFYGETYGYFSIGGVSIILVPLYLFSQVVYGQSTIYLRYTNKIAFMNIATVLTPYLFISLTLFSYYLFDELKLNLIIASNIFAMSIVGIGVFLTIGREINFRMQFPKNTDFAKDIALGLPLMFAFLVETVVIVGDRYVIAYFMTVKDVGSYASAYAIGGIVIVFAKVFGVILPPILSKKIDVKNTQGCINIVNTALKVFLIFSVPFVFGSIILGEDVMHLITNQEAANEAWIVIPIISFATIFFGINMILTSVLFIQKKTQDIFKINMIIASLNMILNIILIGFFKNIEGAAISTAISYAFGLVILQRKMDKKWTQALNIKFIAQLMFLSLIMAFIMIIARSLLIINDVFINVLYGVLVGSSIYIALLFKSRRIIMKEIDVITSKIFWKG
jgi:O-antigen/teichoic acid export membrane protein